MRVNGEVIFSATVAVDKTQAEESKMKMVEYQQDKIAQELGMKIAEEKGWDEYERDNLLISEIRLYVFTPQELKDFMDLKYTHKLKEMGITDESTGNRRHSH